MLNVRKLDFNDLERYWNELKTKTGYYPFQSYSYLKIFSDNFIKGKNLYLLGIFENEKVIGLGGFERVGEKIIFIGMKPVLGKQELTDFGDVTCLENKINQVWPEIINYFKNERVKQLQLDYVRDDSPTLSNFKGFKITKQTVSPFLTLPQTFDTYIASLGRKDRHELKRKLNRLEKVSYRFVFDEEINLPNFNQFITLHRQSDPAKEQFMSKEMKDFFWKVVNIKDSFWETRFSSLYIEEQKVASVLYFLDNKQVLLYNSGFNPEFNRYSVGLISKALMIKTAIEKGRSVLDFLRGDERYKYDLGAKNRVLYKIII